MLHVLKSLSLVCRSGILSLILFSCDVMLDSCSVKKLFAKVGDPTGVPSNLNPLVSSTPMFGWLCLGFLIEYVLMDCVSSEARVGLCWVSRGMMLVPLQDVRMRDFSGFMKHPCSAPNCFRLLRKNLMSMCGMVAERSSTHANRWEMPPYPSSPGSPLSRRLLARSCSSLSIGWSTLFMTKAAKVEESGQPWLMPSFIGIVFHVSFWYLRCTFAGCS